jgi:polyisoprenoid-binding protein YceI
MTPWRLAGLGLLGAALAAGDAAAAGYSARAGSSLTFATAYDGERIDGAFSRFDATVHFDPAAPARCRFDVTIDLASAATGHAERDEVLLGDEFFDVGAAATARFVAGGCAASGPGRYVADGRLTLRGVERPVALAFRWTGGVTPRLDGEATVPRLAFAVGTGDWADTSLLPDAVRVATHLELAPATQPGPTKARTAAASNGQSSSAPLSSRRSTGIRSP